MTKAVQPTSDAQSPKKILCIEADASLLESLAASLNGSGYLAHAAGDAQQAKKLILEMDFDLILANILVPELDGPNLLKFLQANGRRISVLLIAAGEQISLAQESAALGARGFLSRPFTAADLLAQVQSALATAEPVADDDRLAEKFRGLRIEDFISGEEIKFDIYVKISPSKYIRLAREGESLARDRILKYKEKNVTHLYLRKEDFVKYLGFTVNVAGLIAKSQKIARDKKLGFLLKTTSGIMDDLYISEVDRGKFELAQESVATCIEVMAQDFDALSLFELLQKHSNFLFAHSLAVSLYSVLIARQFGWDSAKSKVTVAMCGLLHDIGKKEIDPDILHKDPVLFDEEQRKTFESHTVRGRDLLMNIAGLPVEVAQAAAQHHEHCTGDGYPLRLRKHHLSQISRLLAVANQFCNLLFPLPGKEKFTPRAAVELLSKDSRFDEDFTKALSEIIR